MIKIPKEKLLPEAGIVKCPTTEQEQMTTGGWRVLRPIIDHETCTKDRLCWMYCPEAAIYIDKDGDYHVNLKYCKGCGICASVCPSESITRVPELDFDEVVVRRELPY